MGHAVSVSQPLVTIVLGMLVSWTRHAMKQMKTLSGGRCSSIGRKLLIVNFLTDFVPYTGRDCSSKS